MPVIGVPEQLRVRADSRATGWRGIGLNDDSPIEAHLNLQVRLRTAVVGAGTRRGGDECVSDRTTTGRGLLRQQAGNAGSSTRTGSCRGVECGGANIEA